MIDSVSDKCLSQTLKNQKNFLYLYLIFEIQYNQFHLFFFFIIKLFFSSLLFKS